MKLLKFSQFSALACILALSAAPALAQDEIAPMPIQAAPLATPSSSNTYTETRLTGVEEQIRTLNGRIEQVEFALRRLDQTLQRVQTDNDQRLTRLETAQATAAASAATAPQPVAPPVVVPQQAVPLSLGQGQGQAAPAAAPQADVNGTLGALKVQDGRVTGGVNNPKSPPLPATPPDYGLTSQEQYDRAFNMLREANYADAEQAFKNFIDKNPKDHLIDNAKYWYGETLYVRAHFDEAAIAFADAYQSNPQGTKAPDSLLKLAMSLGAVNKTPDACVTLSELKAKYPTAASTIKSRAEDERKRLKCPTTR